LENGGLSQKSLADGLGLPSDGYVIFRDGITNLEYIRSCREIREQGMYVELGAYKCHTFLDFRFVDGGQWMDVCNALNGAGVPSMQAKFDEMFAPKLEEEEKKEERGKKSVKRKTKETAVKKTAEKKIASKKTSTTLSAKAKKPTAKKKKADG
jgi:hypothetical protein